MKTTLDIPSDLLESAMRCAGARTKREAVLRALTEFTRRARLAELAETLGDSDTFMTHEELMRVREAEKPS